MSGGSRKEREERAVDALLVSALRFDDKEGDEVDPKRLPELTDEERAAMNALGTNFMQRLLAGERPVQRKPPDEEDEEDQHDQGELACAGSDADRGLNRAEEIDAETAAEIERQKREVLERKERERKEGGGGGA
jgi:hypothetical protein